MIENGLLWDVSQADLREYDWRVAISFKKELLPDAGFIDYDDDKNYDEGHIYRGTGDVIQEWDRYSYRDISERIISVSVEREDDRPSSLSLAQADIVVDNYDGLFDPDGTSDLSEFVLPSRPIRILMGFAGAGLRIPQFIGLTEGMPRINEKDRTVEFHCIDYLSHILAKPMDQTVLLQGYRTDQILDVLFQNAGLVSSQYDLDVGEREIPFFYVVRGESFYNVARQLIEAELGRLFIDEFGRIKFKNRLSFSDTIKATFTDYDNIFEYSKRRETDMYNTAEVRSEVRKIQTNQEYWGQLEPLQLDAGETIVLWADFDDPVVSVDIPTIGGMTSSYTANTLADGSGSPSTDIVLDSVDQFASSYKMTFRNTAGSVLFLTGVVLYCSPVPVVSNLFVRESDLPNARRFGERILEIQNDFFVDVQQAKNFVFTVLSDYGLYSGVADMEVKGSPQLQLGDAIQTDFDDGNIQRSYTGRVCKIVNQMSRGGGYQQFLRFRDLVYRPFITYDSDATYDGGSEYQI